MMSKHLRASIILCLSTITQASHLHVNVQADQLDPNTKSIIALINANDFITAKTVVHAERLHLSPIQRNAILETLENKKEDRFWAFMQATCGAGVAGTGAAAYWISQQVEFFMPQEITIRINQGDERRMPAHFKYEPSLNPLEMSAMAAFLYGCFNAWKGINTFCTFDSTAYHQLKQEVQRIT